MFKKLWININEAIAELMGIDYYSDEESLDYEEYSEEESEDYEVVP